MKKTENGKFTIYEENDICSLDEYSSTLGGELEKEFETAKNDRTNIKKSIENIQKEQETQNTNIETLEEDNKTNQEDISNLKKQDISQNELIEQLQKRNALLESQIPTGIAKGENITIKGSSNMPFKKFEISGNDYQKTSEASSNILDPDKLTSGFINADTGALENSSNSYPNATYTPLITVKSTDTLYALNGPGKGVRWRAYNLDGTYNSSLNSMSYSFNPGVDCKVRLLILDTVPENMMIRINNTDSTYEEFTPDMPSIDYPSEVRACGDNVNLFDKSLMIKTSSINFIDIKVKPNTYYTYSSNIPKTYANENAYIFATTIEHGYTTSGNGIWKGQTRKILSDSNGYISLAYRKDSNINSLMDYWYKIEEGSTATPYSEPGQGNMTVVKSNKNILKTTSSVREYTRNGVTITIADDGLITLNGMSTNNMWPDLIWDGNNTYEHSKCRYYFPKPMKNMTISMKHIGGSASRLNVSAATNDDSTESKGFTYPAQTGITFQKEAVGLNRLWLAVNKGETYNNFQFYLQLEEGTTATEIVPHQSKEYIVPTQQPFYEGDTFVKVDGVRYEKHYWNELILTGSEADYLYYYIKNSAGTSRGSFNLSSTIKKPSSNSTVVNWIKSTHFKNGYSANELWATKEIGLITVDVEGNALFTVDSSITSVTTLKAMIKAKYDAGNPVKLVFELATPMLIPCTEDQNAILDEIESDENYKNITHIYSEDEISPTFNVEYYKDRETTEKNLEDRITALEELLSTTATSAMLLDNMQTDLESEV